MTQLPPSPDDAWGRFCGRADGERELWVRPAHLAERHEAIALLHASEAIFVVARWAADDFALIESLHRRISGSFGLMGAFGDASAPLDLDGAFALDPEEHHTRILAEVQGSFRSGRLVMHAAYRAPGGGRPRPTPPPSQPRPGGHPGAVPAPLANLVVLVRTPAGKVVSGATVTIAGGTSRSAMSDGTGTARFDRIPPGSYGVEGTRSGHVEGSATATAPAGATTTVTVILTPIELEIVDGSGVVLTAERTWIVGERVVLTARTKPPGRALSSIQWVVPGEIVAGQSYSLSSGTIAPVAESAFRRETMQFHWIASKTPSRLTVKAATNGMPLEASAAFRVLGPTGVSFTSRTSSVNVGLDKAADLALCFWEQTPGSTDEGEGTPGITWDGKLSPPPGGAGEVAFLQLIRPARSRRRADGTTRAVDSKGTFWLDDAPKPEGLEKEHDPGVFMKAPWRAEASVNTQPGDGDAPSNMLAPEDVESAATDAFVVYLMYRPAKPGAIYVTLARLAWFWAGRAVKEADRWLLVSSDHARNPTGSPSSELPTWSDHFTAHLKDWS